jgi:hypothetical protein
VSALPVGQVFGSGDEADIIAVVVGIDRGEHMRAPQNVGSDLKA